MIELLAFLVLCVALLCIAAVTLLLLVVVFDLPLGRLGRKKPRAKDF